MRKRNLKLKQYGISAKRYKELCGFCEQYPEWKEELKEMTNIKSQTISGLPSGKRGTANVTEDLAIKRQQLLEKCELIEQTAIEADAELYQYIIKNVCYELPYKYLNYIEIPCSRETFYDKRRYFFYLRSKNKKN